MHAQRILLYYAQESPNQIIKVLLEYAKYPDFSLQLVYDLKNVCLKKMRV